MRVQSTQNKTKNNTIRIKKDCYKKLKKFQAFVQVLTNTN